jgi:hypothetical protein
MVRLKANENPNIPIIGAIPPLDAASTKEFLLIGPYKKYNH